MLYNNKTLDYNKATIDRRNTAVDITDDNLNDRIDKFQDQIKSELIYRIPLQYFSDIGKINFPFKIDSDIKCHLETKMKKLFESKKRVTPIGAPDAKTFFTKASFMQYEQFLLGKNFRQHIETIMLSKNILTMRIQKSPMQKTYERSIRSNSINVKFIRVNRQFDWLEILLIYDKSEERGAIYDSCNINLASKIIQSMSLENFLNLTV